MSWNEEARIVLWREIFLEEEDIAQLLLASPALGKYRTKELTLPGPWFAAESYRSPKALLPSFPSDQIHTFSITVTDATLSKTTVKDDVVSLIVKMSVQLLACRALNKLVNLYLLDDNVSRADVVAHEGGEDVLKRCKENGVKVELDYEAD